MATSDLQLVLNQLDRQGERLDGVTSGLAEVGGHCATLLERTTHLATREDVSTAIRTHLVDCKASRAPRRRSYDTPTDLRPPTLSPGTVRALKAVGIILGAAGTAIALYLQLG